MSLVAHQLLYPQVQTKRHSPYKIVYDLIGKTETKKAHSVVHHKVLVFHIKWYGQQYQMLFLDQ